MIYTHVLNRGGFGREPRRAPVAEVVLSTWSERRSSFLLPATVLRDPGRPGMSSTRPLDMAAPLIRPRRVVEAADSMALADGTVIRHRGFLFDATLALVYPVRSR